MSAHTRTQTSKLELRALTQNICVMILPMAFYVLEMLPAF